ncbi:hypothetical protein QR680_017028 [Steinernema hermaphroditum]|uniref:Uncharacterized protein n=1 Tax=Steinernema hermaphroditum TaxID=289476 RepID=A0AA39HD20_9BILA|nr:hypothetical protein QR680_017028 [Steinernema hermaphroditum]
MPFSVSGSFIECFSSIESCRALCSFGECFYVDACNERADANYYCSAVNPYKAIFLALGALFVLFLCCCAGFSFCVWNSMQRRRRLDEPTYVLTQPSHHNMQFYHPRPASRSPKY